MFNKPFFNEKCINNIRKTYEFGIQSGDGYFSKKCQEFFKNKYNFKYNLLVPSCTHALEMMAILLNINDNDEIIIPSYTFVSTANAFVKFGAKIVCVDSLNDNPNIDPNEIEKNINEKTKAVCIVHYGGWSCNMDEIVKICKRNNIILLEDAAQAINCFYKNQPLGTFGDMSAISFHETKNINCGEGGLLVLNNKEYIKRAEIIREKGTNRSSFFKGEIKKYEWIDKGSSYLLSDINCAYLYPQLEDIDDIINLRKKKWELYYSELKKLEKYNIFKVNKKIKDCKGNYHIFYLLFNKNSDLKKIKKILINNNFKTTTHYVPLHESEYYIKNFGKKILKNCSNFGKNLLRFPLYHDFSFENIKKIIELIKKKIK